MGTLSGTGISILIILVGGRLKSLSLASHAEERPEAGLLVWSQPPYLRPDVGLDDDIDHWPYFPLHDWILQITRFF